jgi:hypothetical protein
LVWIRSLSNQWCLGASKLFPKIDSANEPYTSPDVDRSVAFCQKLSLPPSRGPYILVTTEYPGAGLPKEPGTILPVSLKNYEILELNNNSPDQIGQLITGIADQLTTGDVSHLNEKSEPYWRTWQRAFESVRDMITSMKISLKIKTPFFETEVK